MLLLNIQCDLICDVISRCVWSINAGKIDEYDKIVIENQKNKRKGGNQRNVYINLHLIYGSEMEFTAC